VGLDGRAIDPSIVPPFKADERMPQSILLPFDFGVVSGAPHCFEEAIFAIPGIKLLEIEKCPRSVQAAFA
jgi:hypothetical protein